MAYERYMQPSVETLPGVHAAAALVRDGTAVFRDDTDIVPVRINDREEYMPWGADNMMPYNIMDLIEQDETLATCLLWNAQMCYGSGLRYNTGKVSQEVREKVDAWLIENSLPQYFLGVAQDLKHWGFAVSVIILSNDGKSIARLVRKEACYCRFAKADRQGKIKRVYYAMWRDSVTREQDIEKIELLDEISPYADLMGRMEKNTKERKFAIVTRVPTADHTYYPIPYWAAIFRSRWYNIKQLIGVAKEGKIKNSAPIKYLVEISDKYFERLYRQEGITDPKKQRERMLKAKSEILDFLAGAENSGKTWFANFYTTPDGKECHEVQITKIDTTKQGGDWESDIQEAVNMICFTLQVHSNLVGSVPGKSQSNNSGSDKRELYTIAQALQKPYHDLLFTVHHIICRFNGWKGVSVEVPFIQLTTLDENTDAKQVKVGEEE